MMAGDQTPGICVAEAGFPNICFSPISVPGILLSNSYHQNHAQGSCHEDVALWHGVTVPLAHCFGMYMA